MTRSSSSPNIRYVAHISAEMDDDRRRILYATIIEAIAGEYTEAQWRRMVQVAHTLVTDRNPDEDRDD